MVKNIKKIKGFLYCILLCTVIVAGVSQKAKAAGEIAINETNFPDDIFREYVNSQFDEDNNQLLSEEEIAKANNIDISWKGIKNLKGIEYFRALEILDCSFNSLENLDLSKNTVLTILNCGVNGLTNLNLSKNTALTKLKCFTNELTNLDLSKNIALVYLNCGENPLINLNISKNVVLTELNCCQTWLANLDISKNTALVKLKCFSNGLTNLDVSNNTALTELDCCQNELVNLDVSKNAALTNLECFSNELTNLDVSKNTALIYLNCYNNKLTNLDLSKNIVLTNLDCQQNELTNLDVSKNIALENLYCDNNKLANLDVSKNIALDFLYCRSNQLINLDVNTALRYLYCDQNQLTILDLSKNTALAELECSRNLLIELNLNSQTYNKLQLSTSSLHGYSNVDISDLQNVTMIMDVIEVTDITKPATYKVNDKEFVIIYADTLATSSPSSRPDIPSDAHIFSDYNYNNPITSQEAVVYGNGGTKTIDGKKVNNKVFTVYTDILASYKYTLNNKGTVKPSVGKVIVGITKSAVKPKVNSKNKITDTSASKIARAKIKNGQITVTAVGKEGGLVYLWVIDTGSKGVSACCPVNVKLAPVKLEVQDKSGNKIAKNTKLGNGEALEVCVTGYAGTTKTDDGTYTATVASKYQSYVTVTPVNGSLNQFVIKATGLKNNKNTKVIVTFECNQNSKKINLSLIITQ